MGFYLLFLFIHHLRLLIHMLLFVSNFWSMFLLVHLRNLFIRELNIPVYFGISKEYHGIDPSIFGLLSRNVDRTCGIFEKLLLLWWTRPPMVFIMLSYGFHSFRLPLGVSLSTCELDNFFNHPFGMIPSSYGHHPRACPFVDLYSLDHPLGWTCPLVDLYF